MLHRTLAMLCLLLVPLCCEAREALTGPLADYVQAQDDSYKWVKRTEGALLGCKYVELTLTSQTWKNTVWNHQLYVIKPPELAADNHHGLLLIAGGSWKPELADPKSELKLPKEAQLLALAASKFKTPMAILLHVPQQPLFDGKKEDEIIALTFEEYLKTRDATWPLLLPMAKSAVRAMDAVQAAAKQEWNLDLRTFTVTGASKRGWTTWLTAAVDDRVTAAAPMVIDMLNMSPQIALQRESFGDLSEQVADYKERGLDKFIDTPPGKALRKIVDPYEYRNRLSQPKLVILGTNDRYWPLDACNLYWEGLAGEKYLLYVPNNGHGITDYVRVVNSLNALHQHVISGQPLPKLNWQYAATDQQTTLKVTSDVKPSRVRVWTAAAETRDFRDSKWTETAAVAKEGEFTHQVESPATGYAALLGEVVFHEGTDDEFSLSTNVRIVPGKSAAVGGK